MDAYYYRRIYKLIVETRYVEKAELTDEEVWLRAYCASMSNSTPEITDDIWCSDADKCLEDFNKKFRFKHD